MPTRQPLLELEARRHLLWVRVLLCRCVPKYGDDCSYSIIAVICLQRWVPLSDLLKIAIGGNVLYKRVTHISE